MEEKTEDCNPASSSKTDIKSNNGNDDCKSKVPSKTCKGITTSNRQEPEPRSATVSLSKSLYQKPRGNLELFEDMFESWRAKEINIEQEGKGLIQKMEYFEVLEKTSSAKIADLNKTVDLLQTSIDALHNDSNMLEQFGKENTNLKLKLNDKELQIKSFKEELKQRQKEYSSQLCNVTKDHETKIRDLEAEHKKQLEKLGSEQKEIILKKDKEISELKHKTEQAEKDKQSQLVHMSIEFENKLSKIQRQKAAASLNQQLPSSNQEIFRKKLQHLKSEYDKETSSLKEQVRSLQSQLAACESPHQSRSLSTIAGPLSKKTRKQ